MGLPDGVSVGGPSREKTLTGSESSDGAEPLYPSSQVLDALFDRVEICSRFSGHRLMSSVFVSRNLGDRAHIIVRLWWRSSRRPPALPWPSRWRWWASAAPFPRRCFLGRRTFRRSCSRDARRDHGGAGPTWMRMQTMTATRSPRASPRREMGRLYARRRRFRRRLLRGLSA